MFVVLLSVKYRDLYGGFSLCFCHSDGQIDTPQDFKKRISFSIRKITIQYFVQKVYIDTV